MPGKLTLEDAATATPSRNPIGSLLVRRDEPEKRTERRVEVQDYIKRVIGLPGDVVEVNMGVIYVNSEPLNESYQTRMPNYSRYGPITVPPGEVFVLGDNRANSQDSHVIGTVPIRNIEGRAELVFWPPRRVRLISQGGAQGGAQGGG
jgi:signal peptidase I